VRQANITILNRLGLHARAAAKLVNLAKTFQSEIALTRDDEPVDGKSIMSVMLLAAAVGTELQITASGPDEDDALASIEQLFAERFGAPE